MAKKAEDSERAVSNINSNVYSMNSIVKIPIGSDSLKIKFKALGLRPQAYDNFQTFLSPASY